MYLGLPLSHKRPKKRDVQFVVDKVRQRLASWKTNFLSRAGRLILISSTLNTIPSYYMQATMFPVASLAELDRICNNFLWGETEGRNRMHLVSKEDTFLPKKLGGLGIRNHRTLNYSLMAKLGWKMCQGPSNLAQECISSKYVKNTGITKFKNGSHVWQSIGKGWHILEGSCQWKLGNGLVAAFWEDDWLGLGPLRQYVVGPLSEKESDVSVRRVWNTGEWDGVTFTLDLPDFVINNIHSFQWRPSNDTDTPFSSLVVNDNFSLKRAFQNVVVKQNVTKRSTAWVWGNHHPPKIKFFHWLIWHDRIPTQKLLFNRKIVPNPICNLCDSSEEDILHVLRDCDNIREVWNLIPFETFLENTETEEWFTKNLFNPELFRGIPWNTLFSFICYGAWTTRNKFLFESTPIPPPAQILQRACAAAHEFRALVPNLAKTTSLTHSPSPIASLPHNWMVLHTDASFISPKVPAGIAGCLRTRTGNWVAGYQKRIYSLDAKMSELLAILHGMEMAAGTNCRHIMICSDCQEIVTLLNHEKETSDLYAYAMSACREYKQMFMDVRFVFVKREENQVADCLAKKCRTSDSEVNVLRSLPLPPNVCNELFILDCNGYFKP